MPGSESYYRLEDVLIGGGEALLRKVETEYLIRTFRERFPRGSEATVAERRAAGGVILALQSTGLPLADRHGNVRAKWVDYWLELGIDYFAAGHHATERYGVQALGERIAAHFAIEHRFVDVDNPV